MNRMRNMDCREFEILLDEFLSGRLDPATRRRAGAHLDSCPACRELVEAVASPAGDLASAVFPDQTDAILARTSGSACQRARQLIPARIDGALADPDDTLLREHLEHCGRCAALAGALAWTTPVLEELGDLDPGIDFTSAVVVATAGMREAPEASIDRLTRWADAIGERWRRMTARPRFTFEAAYAGTLMLILLFGTPVSPLKDAPPKALAAVQAGPTSVLTIDNLQRSLPGRIYFLGQATWHSAAGGVATLAGDAHGDLGVRRERTRPAFDALKQDGSVLIDAVQAGDLVMASSALDDVRRGLAETWRAWWRGTGADSAAADTSL